MPGARCTRGLVCKRTSKKRTRAYRFSGGIRPSLRSGLRLIGDLLGEPCTFATVARAPERGERAVQVFRLGRDAELAVVGPVRLAMTEEVDSGEKNEDGSPKMVKRNFDPGFFVEHFVPKASYPKGPPDEFAVAVPAGK